jgi:Flp pilus assembly pilin Flp
MKVNSTAIWARFWSDDDGAILAIEWLFYVTIIVLGLVVGYTGLRDAVVTELTETGNAIMALSQGYIIQGVTGAGGSTDGSQAIDTPGLLTAPSFTPPAIPSVIDVIIS